ncbi:MAG: DUF1330 domain-containing protein [Gammaproteobacteria bacterium]|nr:DUF1330 domain-containing protein [Gammaproteobacteria bacterium]
MMAVYVIGHISVKDEVKWKAYRSKVPDTLVPWGAELVFRGSKSVVFSGVHPQSDTVIIRFPGQESARGWYYSSAYQALIPLREEAAEVVLVGFDE